MSLESLFFALLGGILPALIWLSFWLREDAMHPEPRKRLMLAFLAGMLVVPAAIPLEKSVYGLGLSSLMLIVAWASIEEILKLLASYFAALRTKDDDEPLDHVIYLITAALGFAALENTLFLLAPLSDGDFLTGIVTGNLRFIGATLLHVAASASIGVWLAFAYYQGVGSKIYHLICGLATAIVLHTLFNFFIISNNGSYTLKVFLAIWVIIIGLMVIIEKIKKIHRTII